MYVTCEDGVADIVKDHSHLHRNPAMEFYSEGKCSTPSSVHGQEEMYSLGAGLGGQ